MRYVVFGLVHVILAVLALSQIDAVSGYGAHVLGGFLVTACGFLILESVGNRWLLAFVYGLMVSFGVEIAQVYLPFRTADMLDALAGMLGVVLFFGVLALVEWYHSGQWAASDA